MLTSDMNIFKIEKIRNLLNIHIVISYLCCMLGIVQLYFNINYKYLFYGIIVFSLILIQFVEIPLKKQYITSQNDRMIYRKRRKKHIIILILSITMCLLYFLFFMKCFIDIKNNLLLSHVSVIYQANESLSFSLCGIFSSYYAYRSIRIKDILYYLENYFSINKTTMIEKKIITKRKFCRKKDEYPWRVGIAKYFQIMSLPLLIIFFLVMCISILIPNFILSSKWFESDYYVAIRGNAEVFGWFFLGVFLLIFLMNIDHGFFSRFVVKKYERTNQYLESSLFRFIFHVFVIVLLYFSIQCVARSFSGIDRLVQRPNDYEFLDQHFKYFCPNNDIYIYIARTYILDTLFVRMSLFACMMVLHIIISEQLTIHWLKEYQNELLKGEEYLNQWLKQQGISQRDDRDEYVNPYR